MPELRQNADSSLDIEGADHGSYGFVNASAPYNASSVDLSFFVAPRKMVVKAITWRVEVAGTDAGSVTGIVRKVPSGTAITSGTALHSGTANLKGTAATNQGLTLSTTASTLLLAQGDALALDFTGTLTSATGTVSVSLAPA